MKTAIVALVLCALTAACSISTQHTIERPVAGTSAVIVDTPPPATTVYVPN